MKRKIISICIILLLLCGCSSNVNISQKNSSFEKDVKYNTIHNDYETLIHESENGIITYLKREGRNYLYLYPLYFDGNKVRDMISDISGTCSVAMVDECDSLIHSAQSGVEYYGGKVYFLKRDDSIVDYYNLQVMCADLDGSNQKKLFEIKNIEIDYEKSFPSTYLQIHKDKVYIQDQYKLYIADLKDSIISEVENAGVKKYWKLFLWDEVMYLTAPEYNDGENVYFDVILECDLNGKVKSLVQKDMIGLFVDPYNIFYKVLKEDGSTFSYVYNRKSKEHILLPLNYMYVLKHEDKYILDTGALYELEENGESILLYMDEDNEILDQINYTNDDYYNSHPLLLENRYYVYQEKKNYDQGWYAYYDIKDNKISEIKEMEMIEIK